MPLDLGKGIFNLNYRSKRSPQPSAMRSHRIYHTSVFTEEIK
ncbi:MAG: hypothetical protein RMZ69_29380 [Nostoc sp. ChiQUE01a]|nr:hypothetical protein [Nostoc sp. ChiQUE01a]